MADQTMNPQAWQQTIRSRVVIAAALFVVWAGAIEARLVHLQVVKRAELQERQDSQRNHVQRMPARRGDIVDRNGQILATSVDAEAVFADSTVITDPAGTAAALCRAFADCSATERAQLAEKLSRPRPFIYIRRANRVSPEAERKLHELNLPGIGFLKDTRRAYPNNELAAHLLGYVGTDNVGLNGLEATYDKAIKGREGTALIENDVHRRPYARLDRPGTPGATLQLTIDLYLQHVAERELHAAVIENRAAGGSAVIMDPRTGEVLAIANEPTFDPNRYGQASEEVRRNRAIQDVYEPGSTFKIVTASAALEEHVMTPDAVIDVSGGTIHLGSRVVHDTHNYGVLSFTDVLVKSSNVGAIKIGLRLGAERLGRFVRRFGFGTRLSPDMPGENAGIVWDPDQWSESALASVSMGYQISVTALQMVTAASVVANGGEMIQPRVVKSLTGAGGHSEVKPRVLRRAILESTADQLTTIMEGVVERGTATSTQIPGYSIAGKTGTSHKLENRHYSPSDYNASFVGFIPSRKPALAIIVVIDSPHGSHGYYGGTVSAPTFKRIAEAAMRYLGIGPNLAPPEVLFAQQHQAGAQAAVPEPVAFVQRDDADAPAPGVVPDVVGLSAREAIRVLAKVGVTARLTGEGVVVQQEPRPGSAIEPGTACSLALGRPSSAAAGGEQRR